VFIGGYTDIYPNHTSIECLEVVTRCLEVVIGCLRWLYSV